MPKKSSSKSSEEAELLRSLLIVQLGLAEIPQNNIRKIVGGDIYRVSRIMRLLKSRPKKQKKHVR
jgi:hypothetical protein